MTIGKKIIITKYQGHFIKKENYFFEKNNQLYYLSKRWQDVTKKEIYIFILIYTNYIYFMYNKISRCVYELECQHLFKI